MARNTNSAIACRFNCNIRAFMLIAILLAIHYAGVALALDKPNTAPLLQSTASDDSSANKRSYLKKHGDKWFRVTRGTGATPDIIVPASQPVSQTKASAGSGIFEPYVTFPVGSWPEAVAIGDVNGDGRNDLVMTTSYYSSDENNDYCKLFVYIQNSSGILDPPIKYSTHGTYTNRPATVAIGDINHDGRNDVVVGLGGGGLDVFTQNPAGGLDTPINYTGKDSSKIRIADLNHDGLLDVVGIGWGSDTSSIWLQDAAGALNAPVIYNVKHGGYDDLDVGDVNNDGLQDVIVMSGQSYVDENVGILLQQSDGTFGSPVYHDLEGDILTQGVAVGDISGDNRNDIAVTYGGNRPSSGVGTFNQNASGTLDPATSYSSYDIPEAIEIKDVNNDGRNDVIVAHGGWMALGVYFQGADGTLMSEQIDPIPYASHYNPHGLAVGDINGDGSNDVAIADYNNGLVVLYGKSTRAAEVTTSPVTGITSTTAAGGGNVTSDGGLAVTGRGVCWNTTGNPTTGDNCTTDGSGIGTFTSSITGLTPSTTYHVRAYATNAKGTGYGNEVTFTTTAAIASITVTSPNGGEEWIGGDIHPVTWTYSGNPGAKVNIKIYKGKTSKGTIVAGALLSAGTFNWTIPATLPAGTDYRVMIASTSNSKKSDLSDSPITIKAPTITVASPNGGESFIAGNVIPITWSYTGYAGISNAKVKIQLYKGTSPSKTITTSAPLSAGAFNWTIPASQAAGTTYRIKITSNTNSKINDMSDTYFSIVK